MKKNNDKDRKQQDEQKKDKKVKQQEPVIVNLIKNKWDGYQIEGQNIINLSQNEQGGFQIEEFIENEDQVVFDDEVQVEQKKQKLQQKYQKKQRKEQQEDKFNEITEYKNQNREGKKEISQLENKLKYQKDREKQKLQQRDEIKNQIQMEKEKQQQLEQELQIFQQEQQQREQEFLLAEQELQDLIKQLQLKKEQIIQDTNELLAQINQGQENEQQIQNQRGQQLLQFQQQEQNLLNQEDILQQKQQEELNKLREVKQQVAILDPFKQAADEIKKQQQQSENQMMEIEQNIFQIQQEIQQEIQQIENKQDKKINPNEINIQNRRQQFQKQFAIQGSKKKIQQSREENLDTVKQQEKIQKLQKQLEEMKQKKLEEEQRQQQLKKQEQEFQQMRERGMKIQQLIQKKQKTELINKLNKFREQVKAQKIQEEREQRQKQAAEKIQRLVKSYNLKKEYKKIIEQRQSLIKLKQLAEQTLKSNQNDVEEMKVLVEEQKQQVQKRKDQLQDLEKKIKQIRQGKNIKKIKKQKYNLRNRSQKQSQIKARGEKTEKQNQQQQDEQDEQDLDEEEKLIQQQIDQKINEVQTAEEAVQQLQQTELQFQQENQQNKELFEKQIKSLENQIVLEQEKVEQQTQEKKQDQKKEQIKYDGTKLQQKLLQQAEEQIKQIDESIQFLQQERGKIQEQIVIEKDIKEQQQKNIKRRREMQLQDEEIKQEKKLILKSEQKQEKNEQVDERRRNINFFNQILQQLDSALLQENRNIVNYVAVEMMKRYDYLKDRGGLVNQNQVPNIEQIIDELEIQKDDEGIREQIFRKAKEIYYQNMVNDLREAQQQNLGGEQQDGEQQQEVDENWEPEYFDQQDEQQEIENMKQEIENFINKMDKNQKMYICSDSFTEEQIIKIQKYVKSQERGRLQFYRNRIKLTAEQVRRDVLILKYQQEGIEQLYQYFFPTQELKNNFDKAMIQFQFKITKLVDAMAECETVQDIKFRYIKTDSAKQVMENQFKDVIDSLIEVIQIILKTFPDAQSLVGSGIRVHQLIQSAGESYQFIDWKSLHNRDAMGVLFSNKYLQLTEQLRAVFNKHQQNRVPEFENIQAFIEQFINNYIEQMNSLQQYFQLIHQSQNLFSDVFTQFLVLKYSDQNDYLLQQEEQNYFDRVYYNLFNFLSLDNYESDNQLFGVSVKKSKQYSSAWMTAVQKFPTIIVAYILHFLQQVVYGNEQYKLIQLFLFPRSDIINDRFIYKYEQNQDRVATIPIYNQQDILTLNQKVKLEQFNSTDNPVILQREIDEFLLNKNDGLQAENLLNSFPAFTILLALSKIQQSEGVQNFSLVYKVENISKKEQIQYRPNDGQISKFYTVVRLEFLNLLQTTYQKNELNFFVPLHTELDREIIKQVYLKEAVNLSTIFFQYLIDNNKELKFEINPNQQEVQPFNGRQFKNKIIQDVFAQFPVFNFKKLIGKQERQIIFTIQIHSLIEAINKDRVQDDIFQEFSAGGFNVNQGVNILFKLEKYDQKDNTIDQIYFNIIYTFYQIILLIINYLTGYIERVPKKVVDFFKVDEGSYENQFFNEQEVTSLLDLFLTQGVVENTQIKGHLLLLYRGSNRKFRRYSIYDNFTIYFKQEEFMYDIHLQGDDRYNNQFKGVQKLTKRQEELRLFYKEVLSKKSNYDIEGINQIQDKMIQREKIENRYVVAGFSGGLGQGFFDLDNQEEEEEDQRNKSTITRFLGIQIGKISVYQLNKLTNSDNDHLRRMLQIMQIQQMTLFFNTIFIDTTSYVSNNQLLQPQEGLKNYKSEDVNNFKAQSNIQEDRERLDQIVETFRRYQRSDNRFYLYSNVENLGQFSFKNLEAWDEFIQERVDALSKIIQIVYQGQLNCQQCLFIYCVIKMLQVIYFLRDLYTIEDIESFFKGESVYLNFQDGQEQYDLRITQEVKNEIYQQIQNGIRDLRDTKGVNFKSIVEKFNTKLTGIYKKQFGLTEPMIQQVVCIFILNKYEQKEMNCSQHVITIGFVSQTRFRPIYFLGWNGHLDVIVGDIQIKEVLDSIHKIQSGWKDFNKYRSYNQNYLLNCTIEEDKKTRIKRCQQKKKKFQKQIICCYDFETKTVGEMLPYLICFSFKIYGQIPEEFNQFINILDETDGVNKRVDFFNNEEFTTYNIQISEIGVIQNDRQLCIKFLQIIKLLNSLVKGEKYKIKVIAHNAAKFDTIILMQHIFELWGADVTLFGTESNPKAIVVEQSIQFMCSLVMTQLGSLEKACGAKGLNLGIKKLDSGDMKLIETLEQFIYLDAVKKETIVKYCCFDVYMLQKMLTTFNQTMIDIFNMIFQEVFNDQQVVLIQQDKGEQFILKLSLPSTTFEFFKNYLVEPGQQLVGLLPGHFRQFITSEMAKRGGYTQVHNSKCYKYDIENPKDQIAHGIDVCSMYPYQMSKDGDDGYFPYGYEQNFQMMGIESIMKSFEKNQLHWYIKRDSFYFVTYFKLGDGLKRFGCPILIKDIYDEFGRTVPDSGLVTPTEFGDPNFEIKNLQVFNNLFLLSWEKQNWQNFFVVVTGEEIIYMMNMSKRYDQKEKTIIKANYFLQALPQVRDKPKFNPFKTFIKSVYNQRIKAKQQGKQSYQLCLKTIMNSLYGYLIQKDQYQFFFDGRAFYQQGQKKDEEWKREVQRRIFERVAFVLQQQNEFMGRKDFMLEQYQFKYKDIYKIFDSHLYIDEVPKTNGIMRVKIKSVFLTPSPGHPSENNYLGVFITAMARCYILSGNLLLNKLGFKPLLNDTDSSYFLDENNLGVDRVMQILKNQPLLDYQFGDIKYFRKFEFGDQLGQWTINDGNEKNQNGNNIGYALIWPIAKKFYMSYTEAQVKKAIEEGKYEGTLKSKGVGGKEILENIQKSFFNQVMSGKMEGDVLKIMMMNWRKSGLKIQNVEIEKLITTSGNNIINEFGDIIPFNNLQHKRKYINFLQKYVQKQEYQI